MAAQWRDTPIGPTWWDSGLAVDRWCDRIILNEKRKAQDRQPQARPRAERESSDED